MSAPDFGELIARLSPASSFSPDRDVIAAHSRDMATFSEIGTAALLVRAAAEADVIAVMQYATANRIPVVPQGARTGLAGAASAVDGAILLSLERLNAIVEIDAEEFLARVQPGVINQTFSQAVGERGLFYPPDPSSWELSTIGGNVATNAGGLCCLKYGVTADFVRGLRAALPDGRVLVTGRSTAKGVAGYDLTRLLVGSEGTLAVITEVTVALRTRAEAPRTAIALFPQLRAGTEAVIDIMVSPDVRPSLLEIMDRSSLQTVQRYHDMGIADETEALLLIQSDQGGELAQGDIAEFARIAAAHGGEVIVAEDPEEARVLLHGRRFLALAIDKTGDFLSEDVCVPRRALPELVEGVQAISRASGLLITCTGHAGDGNMHPSIIFDARDAQQVARARRAFDEIMALGLRLGGTITGEHGVGTVKREWLARELGPVSEELHHRIKQAFDPLGIMNPGKVLARGEG